MRVVILFPRDSKRVVKGFREEVVEVPPEVLREVFEVYRRTRNVNRAVNEGCEWVAKELSKRWCRSMGRPGDEDCMDEYLSKQGERIIQQCETSMRMWIADVAECVKKCGRDRDCIKECIRTL